MTGKLLLFGGTTEARKLLEHGLPAIYSVVTDYGAKQADGECGAEVVTGRMDRDAIVKFIKERGVTCAIDATHPYAVEATANIKSACEITGTPLMRVLRESTPLSGDIIKVSSCAEAAELLKMLLATDAGTGLMHESFDPDAPEKFTRDWFAWANSMFGEMIYRLYDEGRLEDVMKRM